MKLVMKTVFAAGLIAGVSGLDTTTASALPALGGNVFARSEAPAATVDKIYYRCYGCYRRRVYGYRPYYRPYYGYGYGYRPYYYRPHIGIGIGGIGLGLY